jgi:hypothetical protein
MSSELAIQHRELAHIIVIADPRRSSQISAPNSLDTNSGLVGPGTGGMGSHRTGQGPVQNACVESFNGRLHCWTSPRSIAAAMPMPFQKVAPRLRH